MDQLDNGEKLSEFKKQTIEIIDDIRKAFENLGEGMADAIAQGLTGGIDSFKDFADIIKDLFLQLLRDLIKLAIMNPIQFFGGINPLMSGTGAASGGMGLAGGILDYGKGLIFGGSSILTGLGGTIGAAGGTGSFLGAVGGGMQMVGATGLSGLGTAMTSAASIGGTTGMGIAIGALAPYILPIIGALAAFGVFDDKESESKFSLSPGKKPDWATGSGPAYRRFKEEGLVSGAYSGIFGRVAFGGSGFGKDEQLSDADRAQYVEGMIQLFSKLDEFDKQIVDTFNLTEKSINIISDGVNNLDKQVKKWKTPDIAKYLYEKYKIVFSEVGDALGNLFSVIASGLDEEQVIVAANAVYSLGASIQILADLETTASEAIEAANMTLTNSFYSQQDAIYGMIDSFDGSLSATEALAGSMQNFASTAIQLVAQIEQAAKNASAAFLGSKEAILKDILPQDRLYEYYQSQTDLGVKQLEGAGSFEEASAAVQLINKYGMLAWGVQKQQNLPEDQLKQKGEEWLTFFEQQDKVAQEKFDEFKQAAADSAKATAEAANNMMAAATGMQEAASGMNSAASGMNSALSNIHVSVSVSVEQSESGLGEIG